MSFVIREAKPTDIADIYKYIHALAEYEKAPEEAVLSIEDLTQSLFGDHPQVYCLISAIGDVAVLK